MRANSANNSVLFTDGKDVKKDMEEEWEIQNMMSPSSDRAVPDSFDWFLDNF